jgi:hypothetical protein
MQYSVQSLHKHCGHAVGTQLYKVDAILRLASLAIQVSNRFIANYLRSVPFRSSKIEMKKWLTLE